MDLREIIDQLELCKFVDELGHPLENNVAFIELKKLSNISNLTNKEEYFVTFNKYVHPNWLQFKEIWDRKTLESRMAYNDKYYVLDIKKL